MVITAGLHIAIAASGHRTLRPVIELCSRVDWPLGFYTLLCCIFPASEEGFDTVPAAYLTGIITEKGIITPDAVKSHLDIR
jgi:hypothetical protein